MVVKLWPLATPLSSGGLGCQCDLSKSFQSLNSRLWAALRPNCAALDRSVQRHCRESEVSGRTGAAVPPVMRLPGCYHHCTEDAVSSHSVKSTTTLMSSREQTTVRLSGKILQMTAVMIQERTSSFLVPGAFFSSSSQKTGLKLISFKATCLKHNLSSE